ncbi:MAG: hypothetical protein ACLGHP_08340 [Vicinamibacteria bacterium]
MTMTIDPAGTDLRPGDERLYKALVDLGQRDATPIIGATEPQVVVVVDALSVLGAVADATAILERVLGEIRATSARLVRVDAWVVGETVALYDGLAGPGVGG